MIQHKIKALLVNHLRSRKAPPGAPSASSFSFGSSTTSSHLPDTLWLQSILVAELLSFFVDPGSPDTEIFLAYLGDPEPHLRKVATEVLKSVEPAVATRIVDLAVDMLLKEKNPFICRSIVILLGLYGRREDHSVRFV
jgi:hypothetical protein